MVIELLKALTTPAIAVAGVVIACAQLRIANIRLTDDLFDRRYSVYTAAREFIQQICQKRTVTVDELSSFHYASGTSIFALDQRLADHLQEIKTKAIKAAELFDKIASHTASQIEIQDHWSLLNWLSNQQEQTNEKFKIFLRYPRPWGKWFWIVTSAAFLALIAGFGFLLMLADKSVAQNAFSSPNAGWDDANEYIDTMMADDGSNKAVMAGLVPAIHELRQPIVKIIPVGVCREDQSHLPASRPMFHVALALNCGANFRVVFGVYQALQAILLGEAIGHSFAMLPNATSEITGDAGVERSIGPIGYNVDPGAFRRANRTPFGALWRDFVDGRHKAGHDEEAETIRRVCSRKS